VRNPFNWIPAAIFAVGLPIAVGRFIFGLGWATSGSYDYPWGLFLGFGLFTMVPLSSSGFQLGTAVEIFGRHDFEPIERLALLNGLPGYFFAVVYLLVDLGQPWRLPYPMVVSFGPAAVLFHVTNSSGSSLFWLSKNHNHPLQSIKDRKKFRFDADLVKYSKPAFEFLCVLA
jgi:Ni/Fe-hydrogenase subunit HybB-like protein